MLIKRQLAEYILRMQKVFPILSISGPRQSGKTTLIKYMFPDKTYINLENLDERSYAKEDPRRFLSERCPNGAIIDEAQHAPELFSYLQTHVDETQRMGEFILSGSQNFLLLEKITQSLAGRVCIMHLLPFCYQEVKHLSSLDLDTLLFKGMYPRLYNHDIAPKDWYRSYLATYIERDVRQIKNITDLAKFQKFLKLCAGRIGQLLNLSALSIEAGVDQNTLKSWFGILEASFIAFRLQPYYKNFNKRVVKTPKIYFYDTGLAAYLLEIDRVTDIQNHFMRGALFENFVITEFIKEKWNQGEDLRLYFWRDHKGVEIDIILEQHGKIVPIEIKAGMTITQDYFKNLSLAQMSDSLEKPYIIYAGELEQQRTLVNVINWKNLNQI